MRIPALIIGGGPAGSAAAITLAQAGMQPHLLERHKAPRDCVCGSFIGWDALAALSNLGVDPWALGAQPISRVRLVAGARTVEADLPHMAAGLSRRAMDGALLNAAEAAGAIVARGCAVRTVDPLARTVQIDNGEVIAAESIFLATGKHELRGLNRRFNGSSVGLRALLPPSGARSDALSGMVELHLFDRGYAGLLVQEDGAINLCLSVSRSRMSRAGNVAALMEQILAEAPLLADRLRGDLPTRFDAVAGVPYGWRARSGPEGIFRLGDQGAVIASLAGDGIAIALISGMGAARAMIEGGAAAAAGWQQRLRRQCRRPVGIGEALRHAAAASATRGAMMGMLRLLPRLGSRAAALTRINP